jgi:hypothetical protein
MTPWLEIILPVRNPGPKLAETVGSLAAQTERGFGVVLSDNFSTNGEEHLVAARQTLEGAGIPTRRVRPPFELGRVQHWNWAHAQGEALWLKPLFVGDILFPRYVERIQQRATLRPRAAIIRCEFEVRRGGEVWPAAQPPVPCESFTSSEFLRCYPASGNWIGSPVNMAYRREAWQAAGGYAVHLPVCADLNLYVTLILHHGLETVPERLAAFQLHEQRFSHVARQRPVNNCFELWLILRQARTYCRRMGLPWQSFGITRGVARQIKIEYWQPGKTRLKQFLRGTK